VSDHAITVGAGTCGGNAGIDEVVDDLVVDLFMSTVDLPSAAQATPCENGPDGLPRYGFAEMDYESLEDVRTLGMLEEIALHELGHVLGFGTVAKWLSFVPNSGSTDPRFIGPRALAENSALGRSSDIPVMTIDGSYQPHWESTFLGPEIMATVPDGSALSRLTIASLGDLGYAVDPAAADPYTPQLPADTCIGFSGGVVRCW
jgi:hypothetical protein